MSKIIQIAATMQAPPIHGYENERRHGLEFRVVALLDDGRVLTIRPDAETEWRQLPAIPELD